MSSETKRTFLLLGKSCKWNPDTFKRAVAKVTNDGGHLNLTSFHTLFHLFFKVPLPEPEALLTRRLFALFVASQSDAVSYDECLGGITVLLSADVPRILSLSFKAFDFEDTGLITLKSIETVCRQLCEFLFSAKQRSPWSRLSRVLSDAYQRFCLPSHTLGLPEFLSMAQSSSNPDFLNMLSLYALSPLAESSPAPAPKSARPIPASAIPPHRAGPASSAAHPPSLTAADASPSPSAAPPQKKKKKKAAAAITTSAPETQDLSEFEARLVNKVRLLQAELRNQMEQNAQKDQQIQALQERNEQLEKQVKAQSARLSDVQSKAEKSIIELSKEFDHSQSQLEALCQWVASPNDSEGDFVPAYDSGVVRVGYIMKEGDLMKRWKRRLFVLRGNGELLWFTQKEKPKPRGSLHIRNHVLRKPLASDDVQRHILALSTPERTIHLLFKDPTHLETWALSLNSVERKKSKIPTVGSSV